MKIVAAYLLALLGGNGSPTEKDIAAILRSVGADAEDERIAYFLKSFHGRDVNEVIALGRQKFAALGGGGGGGGVVVASGGGGGAAAAAETPKEEEKKEEPKEESDDDMGFSLFD